MDRIRAQLEHASSAKRQVVLANAAVPEGLLVRGGSVGDRSLVGNSDGLVAVDLPLADGLLAEASIAGGRNGGDGLSAHERVDLGGRLILPCFVEAHLHLGKSQTCPRCPNPTGAINDALRCEAATRPLPLEDMVRRMRFSLECAYAHGTSLVRTHLDGLGDPRQVSATWAAYDLIRQEWFGRVEVQGVANLFLPLWADEAVSTAHINEAAKHEGWVLGAYVPKAPDDGCELHALRGAFAALFDWARALDRPVDLHIDENNSPHGGLMIMAAEELAKARDIGYARPVVFGHCCSASLLPETGVNETIEALVRVGRVTVVANPFTNVWLQDRCGTDAAIGVTIPRDTPRTPQWRGLSLLQEFRAAGISVAASSDNVRDWWHEYGDYDGLEVLKFAVYLGHLDRPRGALGRQWAGVVNVEAAAALDHPGRHDLGAGAPADLVLFNARSWSELLSRPQVDRVVLRGGQPISSRLPEYEELDDLTAEEVTVDVSAPLHRGS